MTVSLSKGQTISLEKDKKLSKVFMGLGWDPAKPAKQSGFLGSLFSSVMGGNDDIDLDASVVVVDENKAVVDVVWFNDLTSRDGAIRHTGDNMTGEGDGDDEVIQVDLDALSPSIKYLVFTVNSFRGQTFDEVDNAFARLVDHTTDTELCHYKLMDKGRHTGVIMATLEKTASGWHMTAHGRPTAGSSVQHMAQEVMSVIEG